VPPNAFLLPRHPQHGAAIDRRRRRQPRTLGMNLQVFVFIDIFYQFNK
jgi:hypothetical protein